MKLKQALVAAVTVGALLLTGCSPSGGDADGPADAKIIRVGVVDLAKSIEPWAQAGHPGQYMWSAMYDALTVIDRDGKAAPALAESWERSDDTTWEFTLKKGVTFQDGSAVDAESVVTTFEFLLSDDGRAQYASHVSNYKYITGVTAIGTDKVEITTDGPRPLLASDVSSVFIVPAALLNQGIEALRANPVGSGPFKAIKWTTDEIRLEPWTDSWRKAPNVKELDFVSIPDSAARFQALQAGDIDVMIGLTPDQEARMPADFGAFKETVGRMMSIKYISNKGGPIADARVRKALNLAVNMESINKNLENSRGTISSWPPPGVNGYDKNRPAFAYDPDQAKKLLAEAGYGSGFTFNVEVTLNSFDNDKQVYEAMQSDLKKVGVDLVMTEIDFASSWLPKHTGAQQWAGQGYAAVWVSAPQYDGLRPVMWYASCDWVAQTYCNPEMQKSINAAVTELDVAKRDDLIRTVFDMMVDDPPALMLFDLPQVWGYNANVKNFESYSVNIDWSALEMN